MKRHTRTSRAFQSLKGSIQLIQFSSQGGTFTWFIPMMIKDVSDAYGKARLLVTPPEGSGEGWVSVDRLVREVEP